MNRSAQGTDHMAKDYTQEQLQRQAMAAKALIEELNTGDDESLTHDLVEGETNFFEAVDSALGEMTDCEIIKQGCEAEIARIKKRLDRAKARIEKLKGMIDQGFHLAEIQSHQFATATISKKKVPPKLIVSDEAQIPAKFFKTPDPVLDKKALFDAIKGGESVPGASQSNGGSTIQIRKV